ncbi:DUF917 domain-containing protein [Streptomyces sp. PT12]|uniref:DUF917 domain-containing protein n=1 Tax=Streptomyces sp. PT12 TaxID=1510197 RepID=UPI000DE2B823|nr:DUF917 domain-containing protein [Streptomyces sp. PT12]RBM06251.1 hypothetical protein DEH69_26660 [Streptomyces sp. PT12]
MAIPLDAGSAPTGAADRLTSLDAGAIDDVALGARVLGSGGGGSPQTLAALARAVVGTGGPIPVVGLADLPADGVVMFVAQVGAPQILRERPPAHEARTAATALIRHLGAGPVAFASLEIGGSNALVSVPVAAAFGVPIVDADGMGRAYPRIDQTTMALRGIPAAPLALASPTGTWVLVGDADHGRAEDVLRAALPGLGGSAAAVLYAAPAGRLRGAVIDGSLSRAAAIGRALRRVQERRAPLGDFLRTGAATALFEGVVRRIEHVPTGSPAMVVTAVDARSGAVLRLDASEEFTEALVDGEVVARDPDVIVAMDVRSWQVVMADELHVGRPLLVLRLPADPAWHAVGGARAR